MTKILFIWVLFGALQQTTTHYVVRSVPTDSSKRSIDTTHYTIIHWNVTNISDATDDYTVTKMPQQFSKPKSTTNTK